MMWRLYVVIVPLLWLFSLSNSYGNTNDTAVDVSQDAQLITKNPMETTIATHNGKNSMLPSVTNKPTTTGSKVARKVVTVSTSLSQVLEEVEMTTPLPATSQTLQTTSRKITVSNERILTPSSGNSHSKASTPFTSSSTWNNTSSNNYLSTVATTSGTPQNRGATPSNAPPPLRSPADMQYGPVIDVHPQNRKVVFNDEVTLRCRVSSVVTPEFSWEFNGSPVGQRPFWLVRSRQRSSVLKIKGASLEHAGIYRCLARTQYGTAVSNPAQLIVQMAPEIIEGPGDHEVPYGTILNLTCKVQAFPPPEISWLENLSPLHDWTDHKFIIINATRGADYTCFYRNFINEKSRLAAKAGKVSIVGDRPNYCARYNGHTCWGRIPAGSTIFVNGHKEEPRVLDENLRLIFQSTTLDTTTAECRNNLKEMLCHATYPDCMAVGGRSVQRPICRRDCAVVLGSCASDWGMLINAHVSTLSKKINFLGLMSCDSLPDRDCTRLWDEDHRTITETTSTVVSTSADLITTTSLRVPPSKLPPREIQETATVQTHSNPYLLLILVISIPSSITLVIIISVAVFMVKQRKYLSQFDLPKNIDLSGLKENPMYGKDFNRSFNPHLAYLEYNRNNVIYEKDIGEGAFGRVFKATAPKLVKDEAETCIAVKMLKSTADRVVTEYFNREAQMIARFSHQNIIRLLGVCFVGKPLCLLLEYMSEGDLEDFLHSRSPHQCNSRTSNSPGNGLKIYQKLNMAKQVANGMVYLKERRFVHRDIATRNCLVNSNMEVKISDFGLARYLGHKDSFTGHKKEHIPIRWTAPEALWYYEFTFASDIWSFGVLLWEIFSYADQPYPNMSHEDVFLHTKKGHRLARPANTPVNVYQFMENCWLVNPAERPVFKQVHDKLASMECEWLVNGEET